MGRRVHLSKSKLISGWRCPKRLWLEFNAPEEAHYAPETDVAFAVGHQVGEAAQSLFPEGTLIGHDQELSKAIEQTQEALVTPGPVTLFEATLQAQGVLVRADILIREKSGKFHLIEVKAATSVKDYFLLDCAIQRWVMEGAGVPIQRLDLAHINNQFVYAGDGDYQGLFTMVDVLDACHKLQNEVETLVREMREVLSGGEPVIAMGPHCNEPFACPFQDYCAGPQPEMPVYWLPGGGAAAEKLMDAGYFGIRDIPDGFLTNELAERCRRVALSGQYFLDPSAAEELQSLGWPRYYFDFETMAPAVPRYAGTRPYSAQAFQWSCHIESQNGALEHREFLADGIEAPMRSCAESLIQALGEEGPVFMYSPYERRIIRGFIGMFPDLADRLEQIVERLYDLHPLTKKYYYHPDMHGSWSIKAVLPTVAPDLDYSKLEIVNSGAMAEPAFLEMIDEGTPPARREALRKALLKYCELDTLAMVRLARFLNCGSRCGQ